MCTVLLPPGDNPIAVNKYIIPYQFKIRRVFIVHVNDAAGTDKRKTATQITINLVGVLVDFWGLFLGYLTL